MSTYIMFHGQALQAFLVVLLVFVTAKMNNTCADSKQRIIPLNCTASLTKKEQLHIKYRTIGCIWHWIDLKESWNLISDRYIYIYFFRSTFLITFWHFSLEFWYSFSESTSLFQIFGWEIHWNIWASNESSLSILVIMNLVVDCK